MSQFPYGDHVAYMGYMMTSDVAKEEGNYTHSDL